MASNEGVLSLIESIDKVRDYHSMEFNLSWAEYIGALQIIQLDAWKQMREENDHA